MLISNILHISLCQAIIQQNFTEMIKLIDIGADVNTQCEYNMNYTPLIVATKQSNYEFVKKLLSTYKANPNLSDFDEWSPLMFAVINNSIESYDIMVLLVEFKANIYQKNKNGLNSINLGYYGQDIDKYNYLTAFSS